MASDLPSCFFPTQFQVWDAVVFLLISCPSYPSFVVKSFIREQVEPYYSELSERTLPRDWSCKNLNSTVDVMLWFFPNPNFRHIVTIAFFRGTRTTAMASLNPLWTEGVFGCCMPWETPKQTQICIFLKDWQRSGEKREGNELFPSEK